MKLKIACFDARITSNRKAHHFEAFGFSGKITTLFMRVKRSHKKPHFVGKAAIAHCAR